MSTPDPTLDTCGCCESGGREPDLYNPPAQSSLAYRIGTHAQFFERMVSRLAQWTIPDGEHAGRRPLAALTTRARDDSTIALLDGWAVVGDVLTFYQERIAVEGFLRTATERRSVLELARAIGYELAPGVASSAYLAFTVDEAQGSSARATIPAKTQVQSIPSGNDELPQTFETSDAFEARVAWNQLRPLAAEPLAIEREIKELYLRGTTTNLRPGDAILLVGQRRKDFAGSERWDFRILKTVETFREENYTRVTWETGLGHERPTVEPADDPEVYALRLRAALFGHNAPDWRAMPDSIQEAWDPEGRQQTQWPDFEIQTTADLIIDLSDVYPSIVVDSWVVLSKPSYVELYRVKEATTDSRTDYTLTSKVTRLTLDTAEHLSWFPLRDTVVYAESEKLEPAGKPIETAVAGNVIRLSGRAEGLQRDHVIIVSGREAGGEQNERSEVAVVATAKPDNGLTRLQLQQDLASRYERSSVTIYANVVHATHGETVAAEVLGSGDGARAHQSFTLKQTKQAPLTHVAAATPTGTQSTLSLRVDDVEWEQRPSLFRAAPDSRSYLVRIDNDAVATVTFGDGRNGARLPTGQENVVAAYRKGLGRSGNVPAASLTLLKTRPFGVRGVNNPQPAAGGDDPERLEEARHNAPVTVLTLDRIVSLQDHADFAAAFSGIGKARADAVELGGTQVVHLTVAASDGQSVPEDSDLWKALYGAIDGLRDPLQDFRLGSAEPLFFEVQANVLIDPAHDWDVVQADLIAALRSAFAFPQRRFGQPVSSAEVIQVLHSVAGVQAVDLNQLAPTGSSSSRPTPASVLPARLARPSDDAHGEILPAELLLIDPAGITLGEMQP